MAAPQEIPLILRRAGAADLALLELECAPDFFARMAGVPRPDPARLRGWLAGVLAGELVIIAERGGVYLGSIALELVRLPWSLELVAADLWTHARSDRPSRACAELVKFARLWASARRAVLYVGDRGGPQTAARARLWAMLGGELAGQVYRFGASRPHQATDSTGNHPEK